jgi:hypothetical protein
VAVLSSMRVRSPSGTKRTSTSVAVVSGMPGCQLKTAREGSSSTRKWPHSDSAPARDRS